MKILVLGATGATGNHLVELAVAQGHEVTALVRDPAKVRSRHPSVKALKGNVTSAAELGPVVRGQDAVLSTLGPRAKADPICPDAAQAVVTAMTQEGVRRIIWLSAGGVGDSAAPMIAASFVFGRIIMPLFMRKQYANHARAEEALRSSALDWTVVRPLQLVDTPTGNPALVATSGSGLGTLKIARQDLAAFMLSELKSGAQIRQMPLVYS